MRKTREGLFFNSSDLAEIKNKIAKYPWAETAAQKVEEEGEKLFKQAFYPMDYSWYKPYRNLSESITQENYQNFNGKLYYGMQMNLQRALILCQNILLKKNEKYLKEVKHTLLYYAENYPLHYFIMVDSGLVLSLRVLDYIFIFDSLRDYFTEEEKEKMHNFIGGVVKDIIWNHEDWKTCDATRFQHCNNHNVWACSAVMTLGLYYYRDEWVEYGLTDIEGIYTYLEDGVIDKGLGVESSLGYNMFSIMAILNAAQAARRCCYKVDLYRHKNSRGISLDEIMLEIFQMASPDLSLPEIADCYGKRARPQEWNVYEYAYSVYGRPEYGWILSKSERSDFTSLLVGKDIQHMDKVSSISGLYKEHGYLTVKTKEGQGYWDSDCFHLAAHFGYNGIHNNNDQMGITLFGSGKVLIRDHEVLSTSRHAFSANVQMELNRSRLAHSTVMVNGRESLSIPYPQTLEGSLAMKGVAYIAVMKDTGRLYPGINQKRLLYICNRYVADIYELESNAENTYDWILHAYDDDSEKKTDRNEELLMELFGDAAAEPKFKWIYNLDSRQTDEDIKKNWNVEGVKFHMAMKGEKGTGIIGFSLPEIDDLTGRMTASVMVRRKGRNAVFAAIYSKDEEVFAIDEMKRIEDGYELRISGAQCDEVITVTE